MLPSGNSGSGSTWTAQNIATALTIYKSVLGPAAGAISQTADGKIKAELMNELESKLKTLEQ